jgi:hypothetical protein
MSGVPMRAVGVLGSVVLLAACASTIDHPAPGGPSFESDEVRFVAPTGWEVGESAAVFYGADVQIRAYVSNQALRQDCPSNGAISDCRSPMVDGLRPGGMLLTWTATACVARSCDLPPARLISIGNRQGVRVAVDNGCEETGFTERSAYYVTVTPQRMDILFTCARDPSDATRSAFLGFLDAIQWRIP